VHHINVEEHAIGVLMDAVGSSSMCTRSAAEQRYNGCHPFTRMFCELLSNSAT
jgi:hypothetical protein